MFFVTRQTEGEKNLKRTKSFGIKFGWNFKRFPYFISMSLKILKQGLIQNPFVTFE